MIKIQHHGHTAHARPTDKEGCVGVADTEISGGPPGAQELHYLSLCQIVLQPAGSLTETARTT